MKKTTIGLTEKISIKGKEVIARIDTGATKSSIDADLAAELKIGPIIGTKLIKSAQGTSTRPLVEITITIAGKRIKALFTIAVRKHMKYSVLIGQNILKEGFLIDPSKK